MATARNLFFYTLIPLGIVLSLLLPGSLYSVKPIFSSGHIRSVIIYKTEDKAGKIIKKEKSDLIVYKEKTRYHNVFLPGVDLDKVPNQALLDLVQGKISSYKLPKEKVVKVKISLSSLPIKISKEIQGFRVVYLNKKFYKQPFVKKMVSQCQIDNWLIELSWRGLPLFGIIAIALFASELKKAIISYLFLFLAVLWAVISSRLILNLLSYPWFLWLFATFFAFISIAWLSSAFFEQSFIEKYFSGQTATWFIDNKTNNVWLAILIVFGYGYAAIITWAFSLAKIVFSLKAYLLFLFGISCLAIILRLVHDHFKNET